MLYFLLSAAILLSKYSEAAPLSSALEQVRFINNGLSTAEDTIVMEPFETITGYGSILLELENVSKPAYWSGGVGVPWPYRFLVDNTSTPCVPGKGQAGMDISGGDYRSIVPNPATSQTCEAECCGDVNCKGYVYVDAAPGPTDGCPAGSPCCFLKNVITPFIPSTIPSIVAATVTPAQDSLVTPPSGIRSAVPLGGISTGAVELRGDGTFHEWTIINQTPGGSSKIQEFPQAFFGIRQNKIGKVLQTAPKVRQSSGEFLSGVEAINYSGTYPVSRLQIQDSSVANDTSLYAFSSYKVGDQIASSRPAAAFVLTTSVDTDFMLQLPLNLETDQGRLGTVLKVVPGITLSTACAQACQAEPACMSWNFNRDAHVCNINSDAPGNVYLLGVDSGLRFNWEKDEAAGCLNLVRPGQGPASGGMSLCIATDDGVATPVWSGGTSDDAAELFNTFASTGSLTSATDTLTGVYGAISVSAPANTALVITMGWYFPNKDHFGQVVGNQYSVHYSSAQDAAWGTSSLATRASVLTTVLNDILALHQPFLGTVAANGQDTSVPSWLGDQLVNSLSHIRTAMWFKDCANCHVSQDPRLEGTGFWRQWESYGCDDLDSIHNDGERHIPYLMFFPNTTRSKLAAWAGNQFTSGENAGMLAEQILNVNPDVGQGRVMSDSSSMFMVYIAELLHWDGDLTSLKLYYPNILKIIDWHISKTVDFGVPRNLETTYDILQFPQYDASSYATVFHFVAMKTGIELATAMNDPATVAKCQASLDSVTTAFDKLQWTEDHYAAGSSGCTLGVGCTQQVGLFSDSFYGQVLMYTLGLGHAVDPAKLSTHLESTVRENCIYPDGKGGFINNTCPNGLLTCTGRNGGTGLNPTDYEIWQMINHDYAALQLHLGASLEDSLIYSERSAKAWSEVQNDQWATAALSDAQGLPTTINHYGYHMTSWHIPLAMSGQNARMYPAENSTLTFTPSKDLGSTWSLPVLLPGTIGIIERTAANTYSLTLTLGNLDLNTLAVDGCEFTKSTPGPQHVAPRSPVVWKVCA